MKPVLLACAALACLSTGATAQTLGDDVRCFLVGSGFAASAKDENFRRGASLTAAFYLGRLDGRAAQQALAAAIRAQGKGMTTKEAAPVLQACAARADAARARVQAAAKAAASAR